MKTKKLLKLFTSIAFILLFLNTGTISQTYSKQNINNFLNGVLDGSLMGSDVEDFTLNTINYEFLSEEFEDLISYYRGDNKETINNFFKILANFTYILYEQSIQSNFTGPSSELLKQMCVPLLIPGDFIFTYKTSLEVYGASLSEEMWKGEELPADSLNKLGQKLGNLIGKLFYNGMYDYNKLHPLAFPLNSLRFLEIAEIYDYPLDDFSRKFRILESSQAKKNWTKKNYQKFQTKSLFDLKRNFLGNKNPNHAENDRKSKELKVKIKSRTLQTNTNTATSSNTVTATFVQPEAYDYRTKFPICATSAYDQISCGSCWAFSSTGALAKRFCQASNGKVNKNLSPQFLVSCSSNDFGCNGGTLYGSWNHLQDVGVVTEECYPYLGKDNECPVKCKDNTDLRLFKTIPNTILLIKGLIEEIKTEIVLNGPVQATFIEIYSDFFTYGSGVYISNKVTFMGYHAMQIIGWEKDYWIVENSWGVGWGEMGIVKIPFDQIGISEYAISAKPLLGNFAGCPENCNFCSDLNTCIKGGCAVGYNNNDKGGCFKCAENCLNCDTEVCPLGSCKEGFRNNVSGGCNICPENCLKCDETACLEGSCKKDYGNNTNGGCSLCPANCKNCGKEGCLFCNIGFTLNLTTKECLKCSNNCTNCNESDCLTCAFGYFKKSDGLCSTCPENCALCGTKKCTNCNKGFIRTVNGDCVKCPETCTNCAVNGCRSCQTGFYLSSTISCLQCPQNCSSCGSKGCYSNGCKNGYGLDGIGGCKKCPENCLVCNASGCKKCTTGFAIAQDKICKKCSENCLDCSSTRCNKCNTSYKISTAGICYKCPDNCLMCREEGCNPNYCVNGFGNDTKGGCSKCPDNCQKCGETGCNKGACNIGFGNELSGGCYKCPEGCKICGNNICLSCLTGFSLDSTSGKCVPCQDNCLNCNSTTCFACVERFGIISGKCKECPLNCLNCGAYGCFKCGEGFKRSPDGKSCLKANYD